MHTGRCALDLQCQFFTYESRKEHACFTCNRIIYVMCRFLDEAKDKDTCRIDCSTKNPPQNTTRYHATVCYPVTSTFSQLRPQKQQQLAQQTEKCCASCGRSDHQRKSSKNVRITAEKKIQQIKRSRRRKNNTFPPQTTCNNTS